MPVWSPMVSSDASSMMTTMGEIKILKEGVIPRHSGKEIVAAMAVSVSRRTLNQQPLPISFDSRSPMERSGFSAVTRPWVLHIPIELPHRT